MFMKALVSTEQIPKEGIQHLELIDNIMSILEKQIQEENKSTHHIQNNTFGKTSSLEDDWKVSCKVPSGWMAKEDQQNIKKDKVFNTDETASLEDAWREPCNVPSGWMAKEDDQNFK